VLTSSCYLVNLYGTVITQLKEWL